MGTDRAARDAAREEAHARVKTLFREIAALLPGKWACEVFTDRDAYAELRREDGLAVSLDWYQSSGKVNAYPKLPTPPRRANHSLRDYGLVKYGEKGPEAHFSAHRPASVLAKEVVRKVVTPYEPMWRELVRRHSEERARIARAEEAARTLSAAIGAEVRARDRGSDRAMIYSRACGVDVDMEVFDSGSVHAKLRLSGEHQVEELRRFLLRLKMPVSANILMSGPA